MEEGGKYDTVRLSECEVGGVHHVVYKCPPLVRHITSATAGKRDGRVFPYVAHYLSTGDMLYPVHEGDAMVNRLLDELTQLDLVHDLLHARTPAMPGLSACLPSHNSQLFISGGRRFSVGGDGNTLKVHTKRRRRISFGGFLTHLLPANSFSTPASSVYRPPSNKGATLVVVRRTHRRCTQLTVHGPAGSLKKLFPGTPVFTTHATYPILDARTTPTCPNGATSVLSELQDQNYHPTVKSSWVEGDTGALVTQWIVYQRRGGPKPLTLSSPHLHHSTSSINLSTISTSSTDDAEDETLRRGTFSNRLRTRSKSIFSLASEHTTTYRPTLTLKRILSVLL